MRAGDIISTLTGFDELAIEQVTGKSFEEISATGRDLVLSRALAAVVMSRNDEKLTLKSAYQKVLGMTQSELGDWYAAQDDGVEDEVFEDDPVTDAGKGDSDSDSEPSSSPDSVSQPA